MNIGDRIRIARKAAGLSQEEVARRASLSLKGMGEIERGDIEDPHISSLAKIARALGVPVEALIKEEEEPALVGKDEAPSQGTIDHVRTPRDSIEVSDEVDVRVEAERILRLVADGAMSVADAYPKLEKAFSRVA